MADNIFQALIDAGVSFTQMTRERAEGIVNELVRQGQVATEEYPEAVCELDFRSPFELLAATRSETS